MHKPKTEYTLKVKKIYVHLIDGTDVWIPVDAKQISAEKYEILPGDEYNDLDDPNYILEFYPGDIIELSSHTFSNGENVQIANTLIGHGQWKDRKLNEFKFKAAKNRLKIDPSTANMYKLEIERIKKQHSSDQFFYPAILETVEKLIPLIKNKKL